MDVALAGMRDQTFKDFEYIVVDHRYERRHDEAMALARTYGVNLIHVPEHRRNGKWSVLASAFATGFALARGRVVIMLVDWTYAPPGWLEAHLQHHQGSPKLVYGPYTYYRSVPKLKLLQPFDFSGQANRADSSCIDEDAVLRGEILPEVCPFLDGPFDPAWLPGLAKEVAPHQDVRVRGPGPGVHYTWTHLKNESLLRSELYRLNGVDVWSERGGRMSTDTEFGLRAEVSGQALWWEPAAHAHCVNPRGTVCRVLPFGVDAERYDGRWSLADCKAYFARREGEIRAGDIRAKSPVTLEELARRLAPWRELPQVDTSKLDRSDHIYFGGEIWPNSS